MVKTDSASRLKEKIKRNKWLLAGLAIGFFNPLAGIVYSFVLTTEPNLKKTGQYVLVFSIVLWVIIFILARKYAPS